VGQLGYRPALDGVRALAIAPVVGLHAFDWPRRGSLGVDLFFVLSGFLITTLLLEERFATGRISFSGFYRRRFARLFPALLVMLALFTLVTGGAHAWAVLAGATYTANFVNVVDSDAMPFALGHLWSLAQEEQFYLVWPPLLVLLTRARKAILIPAIVVLIAVVVTEKIALLVFGAGLERIYFGPDTHADPILVGCLFGALFARRAPAQSRLLGPLTMAALLCLFALAQPEEWFLLSAASPFRILFAFAAALLIVGLLTDGPVTRLLATKPFVFIGRISYSLYLWHVPILVAFAATASDDAPLRSALAIVATVLVATASFYGVERPLRRRFRRSRRVRTPDVLAPALQPR
jgi:peptidoglycan/LPS O-acetylase OafA/YrhL